MKNMVGYVVTFLGGGALGAVATYFKLKKRFDDTLEATTKANKEMYEAKLLDLKAEKPLDIEIPEKNESESEETEQKSDDKEAD